MKISRITTQCIRAECFCTSVSTRVLAGAVLCGAMVTAASASGHDNLSEAQANFRAERANCLNGRSNQDRTTCLKEAGAAFDEAKRGRLNDGNTQYQQNVTIRCQKLDADSRQACERRMRGEGVVTGSVASGGLYRELSTPIPAQVPDVNADERIRNHSAESGRNQ